MTLFMVKETVLPIDLNFTLIGGGAVSSSGIVSSSEEQ